MKNNFYYHLPIWYYFDFSKEFISLLLTILYILLFILSVITIFKIVYNWIIFKKAGREGWESIIPIYNLIVKFEFLDIPSWMIVLFFIPVINIIIPIVVAINMAKKFNKDVAFIFGLIFLPLIFYPILAFGSSKYDKNASGIFNIENNNGDIKYCSKCGAKAVGPYCSNCGKKIR